MLSKSTAAADANVVGKGPVEARSDYLLVCHAKSHSLCEGTWHFSLESADGSPVFSADDEDHGDLNRLTLLAAVRGLESIDGAAAVTLLSNNRYLIRSLADSLPRWRENDFVWEHFGRRIDVQHADLWRRIDRALNIHRVEACLISSCLVSQGQPEGPSLSSGSLAIESQKDTRWRVDSPHRSPPRPRLAGGRRSPSVPQDQLRRWLLGDGTSSSQPVRRRFTAADLMESA